MRTGDIEQLYSEHAAGLFRVLVYRLGDRVEAEDVLADTFERALRARRRFDPRRGSATTWLYAIALNLVRDRARARAAEARAGERVASELDQATPSDMERAEERTTVLEAVRTLNPDQREVVALRFGADLKLETIARVIDEPRTTVEGRLHRALRKMRAELE